MNLAEQMRPKTWAEVVGQDGAFAEVQSAAALGGYGGQAWWITGASGTGKTTIARLIAAEVADPCSTLEIDAVALNADLLRSWADGLRMYRLGSRNGHALIINEAHGLRKDMVLRLLVVLEALPDHAVIVLTTTNDGQAALFEGSIEEGPMLQRCTRIQLARRGLAEAFARRLREVAQSMGRDGLPLERYVKVMREEKNSLRGGYERLARGKI